MNSYFVLCCFLLVNLTYLCQARPESTLIIQGEQAQSGQFPWQASIHSSIPGQPIRYFGGSLISQNFILTCAFHIAGATSAQVQLGSILFSRPLITVESRQFTIHPQYNPSGRVFDFALIRLPFNIQLSQTVQPIRLPTRSQQWQTFDNANGLVSGFGVSVPGSLYMNEQLLFARQTVISNAQCVQTYGVSQIRSDVLCATGTNNNGQSACYGDTGGPLAVRINNVITQIGLVSFYPPQGCNNRLPVGFARLTAALDWISGVSGVPILP